MPTHSRQTQQGPAKAFSPPEHRAQNRSTAMSSSTPAMQMQTPPPTRDASTKRKPQQPRLPEFSTPPTIRRMSAPHDAWSNTPLPSDHMTFAEMSPFAYTPLQFSPFVPATGFAPSGPMTAPAYTNQSVFWEPNSNHTYDPTSFTSVDDDPFGPGFGSATNSFTFASSPPTQHRYSNSDNFLVQYPVPRDATRPQTAIPAARNQQAKQTYSSASSSQVGIDPSVLQGVAGMNTQDSSFTKQPPPGTAQSFRQPYQHQMESLQREKAERADRAASFSLQQPAPSFNTTTSSRGGLRRSLTDSKIRSSTAAQRKKLAPKMNTGATNNAAPGIIQDYIPRDSSPLKRHKANPHHGVAFQDKIGPGQDVKIVVDARGHASPRIVEMSPKSKARVASFSRQPLSIREGASESDSEDLPGSSVHSSAASTYGASHTLTKPAHSPGDARVALQELIEKRQSGKGVYPHSVSSSSPAAMIPTARRSRRGRK